MIRDNGRECVVRTISRQTDVQGEEQIIMTQGKGQLSERNGVLYVLYKENTDEGQRGESGAGIVKNLLKIEKEPERVCLKRSGAVSSEMIFAEGKKNSSLYKTSYGTLEIGTETRKVSVRKETEKISLQLMYALFIQDEKQADCRLKIEII